MNWLEVQLTVKGELAEPVAEVLSRYCSGGVVITSQAQSNSLDEMTPLVTVAGYLPLELDIERAKEKIETGLWHLSQISPLPDPSYQPIKQENWAEAWRDRYQPIAIGQRLLIQPPWLESADSSRTVILIDPGMAFGTGTHPTTILCLEFIEQLIQPEMVVVDLGCGSGILGIAAVKLGADQVFAYDHDVQAIESATENSTINQTQRALIPRQGSLPGALDQFVHGPKPDLVVANILATVISEMLNEGLAGLLGAESKLILSGILEEQVDDLLAIARGAGLDLIESRQQEDWVALLLKKQPAPQGGAGFN